MAGMFPDVDTAFNFFTCTYLMFAATIICTFQRCIDLGVPRPLLVAWLVVFIMGALSSFLGRTRYLASKDVLDPWHDRCIRGTAYASFFVCLDIVFGDELPAFLRTIFRVALFGGVAWWEGPAAWTAVTTWLVEKRKQQRLERKATAARRRKQEKRDRAAAAQAERLDREAAAEAARAALDREAAEAARAALDRKAAEAGRAALDREAVEAARLALDREAAVAREREAREREAWERENLDSLQAMAAWAAASEEKSEEPEGREESKYEPARRDAC